MKHNLYERGDAGCPDQILDRNGDVVLGLCKACGQAEADLAPDCPMFGVQPWRKAWDDNKCQRVVSHVDDEIERLRKVTAGLIDVERERNLLAEAIGQAAIKSGIYRSDLEGMTGPQLLQACNDMAECLTARQSVDVGIPVSVDDKAVRAWLASREPSDEQREDILSGDYDHTAWFQGVKELMTALAAREPVGQEPAADSELIDDLKEAVEFGSAYSITHFRELAQRAINALEGNTHG